VKLIVFGSAIKESSVYSSLVNFGNHSNGYSNLPICYRSVDQPILQAFEWFVPTEVSDNMSKL
jgi:hypothetical protein